MKAIILTQEACPSCNSLKLFLLAAMGGKYDDKIEFIKKEENEELYREWVERVETMQTPTTIFLDGDEVVEVLTGFNPAKQKKALETHL